MELRIQTPPHSGARDQARQLVEGIGPDLAGKDVTLDCANMLVGTPSFLDEIVKQVLVLHDARALCVQMASARAHDLLERSAENRGLRERLRFAVPS